MNDSFHIDGVDLKKNIRILGVYFGNGGLESTYSGRGLWDSCLLYF